MLVTSFINVNSGIIHFYFKYALYCFDNRQIVDPISEVQAS